MIVFEGEQLPNGANVRGGLSYIFGSRTDNIGFAAHATTKKRHDAKSPLSLCDSNVWTYYKRTDAESFVRHHRQIQFDCPFLCPVLCFLSVPFFRPSRFMSHSFALFFFRSSSSPCPCGPRNLARKNAIRFLTGRTVWAEYNRQVFQ